MLVKNEKDIDALIGKLIRDLETLRKHHREHVSSHFKNSRKYSGLVSRLISGEPLDETEATGDTISKLIKDIK